MPRVSKCEVPHSRLQPLSVLLSICYNVVARVLLLDERIFRCCCCYCGVKWQRTLDMKVAAVLQRRAASGLVPGSDTCQYQITDVVSVTFVCVAVYGLAFRGCLGDGLYLWSHNTISFSNVRILNSRPFNSNLCGSVPCLKFDLRLSITLLDTYIFHYH